MGDTWFAVSSGHSRGVFRSWDSAKVSVNGYPGAAFRGFRTRSSAVRWLRTQGAISNQSAPFRLCDIEEDGPVENALTVYTKGSFRGGKLRISALLVSGEHEFRLSSEVTDDVFAVCGARYHEKMSSQAAELMSVIYCLHYLKSVFHAPRLRGTMPQLIFCVDFIGIVHWSNGTWKAGRSYIRPMVDKMHELIREVGPIVVFTKVSNDANRFTCDGTDVNEIPDITEAFNKSG